MPRYFACIALIGSLLLHGQPAVAMDTDAPAMAENSISVSFSDDEYAVQRDNDNDPFEPVNRVVFQFNEVLDSLIIDPLAHIYRDATPDTFQSGVRNFLHNIWTPVSFLNSVLQAKPERAAETVGRFLVNSIFGFFGLFDVATELGLEAHDEDFGQTLAVWGVVSGPYIVLPIIGPTNLRDAIGRTADYFVDPYNYLARTKWGKKYEYIRWSASVLSIRASHIEALDSLKETSIDFYATIRSLYDQHRQDKIWDGRDLLEEGPESFMEEDAFFAVESSPEQSI